VNLRFDHPALLWLALLAIPLVLLGMRALSNMDRLRRATALALRTILLLAMVFMLAGPHAVREHDHLTVIGLLDVSGSVQRFADLPSLSLQGPDATTRSTIEYLREWFRKATGTRHPDDRFGLVVFDG
jgi:hypothetical protein